MRAATFTFALIAMATAACNRDRSEQNIAIENNAAAADIEALPPDESSATPTNELENGADNAEGTDLNVSNGY